MVRPAPRHCSRAPLHARPFPPSRARLRTPASVGAMTASVSVIAGVALARAPTAVRRAQAHQSSSRACSARARRRGCCSPRASSPRRRSTSCLASAAPSLCSVCCGPSTARSRCAAAHFCACLHAPTLPTGIRRFLVRSVCVRKAAHLAATSLAVSCHAPCTADGSNDGHSTRPACHLRGAAAGALRGHRVVCPARMADSV